MTTTNGQTWSCHTESHHGAQVLQLAGELDMSATSALNELLQQTIAQSTTVEADLTQVRFIDSTVITTLIAAHHTAVKHGCHFTVTNPHGQVRRVLEVTGVMHALA
jgi:anti-sigma B factor antagonist